MRRCCQTTITSTDTSFLETHRLNRSAEIPITVPTSSLKAVPMTYASVTFQLEITFQPLGWPTYSTVGTFCERRADSGVRCTTTHSFPSRSLTAWSHWRTYRVPKS